MSKPKRQKHARQKEDESSVVFLENSQACANLNDAEVVAKSTSKYQEACEEIQKNLQKYLETHNFEEESDEEDIDGLQGVLDKVLKGYDQHDNLGSTHQYLENSFKAGALVCLICLENVKKLDAIWSCTSCFNSLHIVCIQKWAKDCMFRISQMNDVVDDSQTFWTCPKCRFRYSKAQVPARYMCFCTKVEDPKCDPWLMPHSCGAVCRRKLNPDCGHTCLLLCHPGPCPPCPKMVSYGCYCGQQPPKMRRCSNKSWSCQMECRKLLSCEQHYCQIKCHPGDCPPCPRRSNQMCLCGNNVVLRNCAEPRWQCDKVCSKKLSCGHHMCAEVCHAGPCKLCPLSGPRMCPCGKMQFNLPCTEEVPSCGDTCGKLLSCGIHSCADRCHKGPCASCIQFCTKKCRCGSVEKEMACSKEFMCEKKCKKYRGCGRHFCNRKCCLGNCPPCEQLCKNKLLCGNHKCESQCHRGQCYPCPMTFKIACRCGNTSITVLCGREKCTKPPRCNKRCCLPSKCHHSEPEAHRCHMGDCPLCRQICDLELQCGHKCTSVCHDAVPVKVVDNRKRVGPWEPVVAPHIEIKKFPCPPCKFLVAQVCKGKHEEATFACSELCPYSCGRKCGRLLSCTNHTCSLECHVIEGATDAVTAGVACQPCESVCSKDRPPGCHHPCRMKCHPGECEPCLQKVRHLCHCGLVMLYVECCALRTASEEQKELLLSCKSQCKKKISCGHQCQKDCHIGECSLPEDCQKKQALKCPCRRIRKDCICRDVILKKLQLSCNEICEEKIMKMAKLQEETERRKAEEEAAQERKELEEFERKFFGKKKRRERFAEVVKTEKSFKEKYISYILFFVGVCFVIFACLYAFN